MSLSSMYVFVGIARGVDYVMHGWRYDDMI